jgi:hypothetical protein
MKRRRSRRKATTKGKRRVKTTRTRTQRALRAAAIPPGRGGAGTRWCR